MGRLALLFGLLIFVLGMFFVVELLVRHLSKAASKFRLLWHSVFFAGMVIFFIACGVEIGPGIVIDPRGAAVALAFAFGGPIGGWVTVGSGILTRITVGGAGMISGVAGLLCSGAVLHGLTRIKLLSRQTGFAKARHLLLFGSVAGTIDALSLLLTLNHGLSWTTLLENGLVTCLVQSLGTLGFGSILYLELRELNDWELHRSAIRNSIDGFVLVGPDGKIQRANPAMKSLTGRRTTDLRTLHWDELVCEPPFSEIEMRMNSMAKTESISFETIWAFAEAASMTLEGSVTRAPEEFGGFFAYFHDVTASRRHQNEIGQIYELVPELICLVNEKNEFERLNPAWQSTLGFPPGEMLGKRFTEFIHAADVDTTESVAHSLFRGSRVNRYVNRYRHRNGSYRWLEWSAVRLTGRPVALGVARDITDRRKVEEKMMRYHLLANSARDIMLFIRPGDGRLVDANRSAVEAYGYSMEELLQMTIFDLRTDPRDIVEDQIQQTEVEGQQFETIHRRSDGSHFPVEVNVRRGEIGGEELLFSVIRDISIRTRLQAELMELNSTLERRAEEKAREARDLYDRAPCGYHSLDADGLVMEMNATELSWLGFQREEVVGIMNYGQFLDEPSRMAFERALSGNSDGATSFTQSLTLLSRNGSRKPVLLSTIIERGEDGRLVRSRSTLLDYTTQSELEMSILAAKAQADAANRAKSAFLANMSHELRTPLNSILGFSQLLCRDEALSNEVRQKVATIRRSGEHLFSMISEILELARIESGQLTVRPTLTNLWTELEEIGLLFGQCARSKGLEFQFDPSGLKQIWVTLDSLKWRQIINNLLDNAIKFTDCGRIQLAISSEQIDSGRIQISGVVTDSGPGISEADQIHLFEPFFRGESGLHRIGSTGLGLAISRQFARCLGGDLTLLSKWGEGCTFSFQVLADPACAPSGSETPKGDSGDFRLPDQLIPCRVLVVDDEANNRRLIRDILEPRGFEVIETNNGQAAVQFCTLTPPGLVLMDLRMPVMGGLEAIRQIRAQANSPIQIIAVTAAAFKEDRLEALDAGADDFICKPFVIEQLWESIVRLIGRPFSPVSGSAVTVERVTVGAPAARPPSGNPIPSKWLAMLEEFSAQADFRAVLETVRLIDEIEPGVRDHLNHLAESFDFDGISQWVARSRTESQCIPFESIPNQGE